MRRLLLGFLLPTLAVFSQPAEDRAAATKPAAQPESRPALTDAEKWERLSTCVYAAHFLIRSRTRDLVALEVTSEQIDDFVNTLGMISNHIEAPDGEQAQKTAGDLKQAISKATKIAALKTYFQLKKQYQENPNRRVTDDDLKHSMRVSEEASAGQAALLDASRIVDDVFVDILFQNHDHEKQADERAKRFLNTIRVSKPATRATG